MIEVRYTYKRADTNEKFRTQKHETMRMAIAAANFLDAKGDYDIVWVKYIEEENETI
jgi:hypothetical protein